MIIIITGPVNSGKTTRLLSRYQACKPDADGFAITKAFHNGVWIGQDLLHLATGKSSPFSYLLPHLPPGAAVAVQVGQYAILNDGLAEAWAIAGSATERRVKTVFTDEFGPVELQGMGLWPVFEHLARYAASGDRRLCIAVRQTCLDGCIGKLVDKPFHAAIYCKRLHILGAEGFMIEHL